MPTIHSDKIWIVGIFVLAGKLVVKGKEPFLYGKESTSVVMWLGLRCLRAHWGLSAIVTHYAVFAAGQCLFHAGIAQDQQLVTQPPEIWPHFAKLAPSPRSVQECKAAG